MVFVNKDTKYICILATPTVISVWFLLLILLVWWFLQQMQIYS